VPGAGYVDASRLQLEHEQCVVRDQAARGDRAPRCPRFSTPLNAPCSSSSDSPSPFEPRGAESRRVLQVAPCRRRE
jgi:hypothetical protein